jgi:hypothetical protein
MKRGWLAGALVATIAAHALVAWWWLGRRGDTREAPSGRIQEGARTAKGPVDLLDPVERDWYRRVGLDAPADSLAADLLRHPELIPAEGVVGGTMAFRRDAIYVLPGGHVWAVADDGHIETAMLLRFDIDRDRTITWRAVYHFSP